MGTLAYIHQVWLDTEWSSKRRYLREESAQRGTASI